MLTTVYSTILLIWEVWFAVYTMCCASDSFFAILKSPFFPFTQKQHILLHSHYKQCVQYIVYRVRAQYKNNIIICLFLFEWSTMSNISSIFIWFIASEQIGYILAIPQNAIYRDARIEFLFLHGQAYACTHTHTANHVTIKCYQAMAPVFLIPIN